MNLDKIIETSARIAAGQLTFDARHIIPAIKLFEEGSTLPFVARYRKEVTGGMDEVALKLVLDTYFYQKELEERRLLILKSIEEQKKLTPELKAQIDAAESKQLLEDLYLPFKPKRKTRASIARENGLEPIAHALRTQDDYVAAIQLVLSSTQVTSLDAESCLAGALDIIAEGIAENPALIGKVRDQSYTHCVLTSVVKEEFVDKKTKFSDYYNFQEPLAKMPAHRVLAIRRGEKEKILRVSLELPAEVNLELCKRESIPVGHCYSQLLARAVEDAYKRLIAPQIEVDLRMASKQKADEESIKIFCENLKNLMLAPYGGERVVLGIDPGYRTGSKAVVIDATGKLLDYTTIFPTKPQEEIKKSEAVLDDFLKKYNYTTICIGNGTASRELFDFASAFLNSRELKDIHLLLVNESGASVYSASEVSRKEFPDLDLTYRGSVSIARRFQDPLAELVKIDPKSIGVGQYQHDVSQTLLKKALDEAVEHCVNFVGVNLNTASASLLARVSGLSTRQAEQIIAFRNEHGAFQARKELLKVSGLGAKTFEQCAGFLRIPGAPNPLDSTAVHPESYSVVQKIAEDLELDVSGLILNSKAIDGIKRDKYVGTLTDKFTLQDMIDELKKPGRDPREEFKGAALNRDVRTIADLKLDMVLEGTVTNMTKFGAFVDIGVHRDGLVHLSEMSDRFIKDPSEICKVGQIVKVRVVEVQADRERISLSMLLNPEAVRKSAPAPNKSRQTSPPIKEQAQSFTSVEDFAKKFNSRFSR